MSQKIIIDAEGSSYNREALLQQVDLTNAKRVLVRRRDRYAPEGSTADVIFFIGEVEIHVLNGYGIGYTGTAACDLVRDLIQLGFSEKIAEKVFTCREMTLELSR